MPGMHITIEKPLRFINDHGKMCVFVHRYTLQIIDVKIKQ